MVDLGKKLVGTVCDDVNEDVHFFDDKGELMITDKEVMDYIKRRIRSEGSESKKGCLVYMTEEVLELYDLMLRDQASDMR